MFLRKPVPTQRGCDVGWHVTYMVSKSPWYTVSSLLSVASVVTRRQLLILLKSSFVVFRWIFNMKGKRGKIKNKCGQTLKVWLSQEFHLHFVASTNPPQLLAKDF